MFFRRLMKDLILPVAVAVALAFLIQASVAKPYEIPTGSMEPTIMTNDRVIANRVIYHFRDIERGDIIVFQPTQDARRSCECLPGAPCPDSVLKSTVPFVKRVIGLPGDRIEIDTGSNQVRVNGTPLDIPNARQNDGGSFRVGDGIFSAKDEGRTMVLSSPVPAGKLFVLGDNRGDSCDSHQWSDPFVPRGNVIGQAEVIYWPLPHVKFLS